MSRSLPFWLMSRRIAPADLRHDGNSFTALRWILASAVMISHGWDLTQPARGLDPTVAFLSFPISRLAVFLFFALSGFLVTGSVFKRGPRAFATARALRLIPGLWVMLLVVPVLLWLGFATIGFAEFFTSPQTWAYVWRNALLVGGAYHLPGVFETHPLPNLVNGSLWTIPHEVRCYIALALAAAAGMTVPRWRMTALILAGFAAHLLLPPSGGFLGSVRELSFCFFLGVLGWLWREKLLLSWPLAVIATALALHVADAHILKTPLMVLAFAYLVLVSAFCVPAAWKTASARMPDYSYGIYIYAFPAQQAAMAMGADRPLANIALAFAMTLPLAALSWHFIEKPALALKTGKTLPEPAR